MKRRILLITLLICSLTMCNVVNAAVPAGTIKGTLHYTSDTSLINTGIDCSTTTDSNCPTYRNYPFNTFEIRVNNVGYEAYCIRPHLAATNGADVSCSLLPSDEYQMTYALMLNSTFANESTLVKDIAYRTAGIMDNQSSHFLHYNELMKDLTGQGWSTFFAALWNQYAMYEGNHVGSGVEPSIKWLVATNEPFVKALSYVSDVYKYWIGQANYEKLDYKESEGNIQDNGTNLNGKYFKLEPQTASSEGNKRFKITSNGNPSNVVINVADGLKVVYQREWSNGYAIIEVSGTSTKNGSITVTGTFPDVVSSSKNIYLCQFNNTSDTTQKYIAFLPSGVGDKFNFNIDIICVENKITDELPSDCSDFVDSDHVDSDNINTCCIDGLTSDVREYSLDDLFCSKPNQNLQASYYSNKCYNSQYKDQVLYEKLESTIDLKSGTVSVSDYCQIYCTERMEITVPSSLISASGKYFKLKQQTVNNITTSGPVITGAKRCTIKINYKQLRQKYEDAVMNEVKAYNGYQSSEAGCQITNFEATEFSVDTPAQTLTYTKKVPRATCDTPSPTIAKKGDVYQPKGDGSCEAARSNCTAGKCICAKEAGCTSYVEQTKYDEVEKTNTMSACTEYYEVFALTGPATNRSVAWGGGNSDQYYINFYNIKVNSDFAYDKNSFSGLSILPNKNGSIQGTITRYKFTKWPKTEKGTCKKAYEDAKTAGETDGYTLKTDDVTYNSYRSDHSSYPTFNTREDHDTYCKAAEEAKKSYNTYHTIASDYENVVYGCENFFAGTTTAKKYTDDPAVYNISPTAKFNYLQIYLNEKRKKETDWTAIDYGTATCTKEYHTGDDTEANTEQIFSTLFGNTAEKMYDTGELQLMGNANDYTTDIRDQSIFTKAVRANGYYTATCSFKEPDVGGQTTLYPTTKTSFGVFNETNQIGHNYQFQVYLTTYEAQYTTYWEIKNLGGTSSTIKKFTKAFNEQGKTCAERNLALSSSDLNDSIKNPEDLKNSSNDTVPITCSLQVKAGGMRVGYCNNGVGSADSLCTDYDNPGIFEFRVVDPANIFPGSTWLNNDKIASNWKDYNGNFGKTYNKIVSIAKTDKTYAPENLSYSFKLDSDTIKAIKDYNSNKNYFSDDSDDLVCAEGPSSNNTDTTGCGTIGDSFSKSNCLVNNKPIYARTECKSKFITELSQNNPKLNDTTLKNKVWNSSTSLDAVRKNKVNWA